MCKLFPGGWYPIWADTSTLSPTDYCNDLLGHQVLGKMTRVSYAHWLTSYLLYCMRGPLVGLDVCDIKWDPNPLDKLFLSLQRVGQAKTLWIGKANSYYFCENKLLIFPYVQSYVFAPNLFPLIFWSFIPRLIHSVLHMIPYMT